jgi:hypothetical protein
MQKPKLRIPLDVGDRVSVIDNSGLLTMATVLSCNIQGKKEEKDPRWDIVVWIAYAKELQTINIGSYSSMISEYTPDLDV